MKIEILGSGCKRCEQLYENTVCAASDFGPSTEIEITKINDVNYFTKKGVFMTPGLVIDGKVASVGKVLSVEEVKEKIKETLPSV
jgi:small redox-active disulfide protein 2